MQRRTIALTLGLGLVLMLASTAAQAQYQLTNLASNQVGWAHHTDPQLVNGWGLAYGPTSPIWVSDQGSGWSTIYNAAGAKQGLEVEIPSATDFGTGSPTGIVFNGSNEFPVAGWNSIFIFATLDGTISGWSPISDLNNAIIAVNNPGAVYTGLAITHKPSGNFIFAADTANNKVDVYDGTFTWVKSFTDTTLPAGFSPFGIQDINGQVYVSFASTSGGSGGVVDIFGEDGTFVKQLVTSVHLNQPWGITIAPKNFGPLSNTLLISNNTNQGIINGYNAANGEFVGTLRDTTGKVIHIDQLWAVAFGGGAPANGAKNKLFFTAGPKNNLAGTFGSIVFK